MGEFYKEIRVERGLTAPLRKVNARRREKGKKTRLDPTRITVTDMQMGEFAGGSFFVRTCNVTPAIDFDGGWTPDALRRLSERRTNGGDAKGRVLYGVLDTMNNGAMTVAAVTYHYERAGEIVITGMEATRDLTDHRWRIFQAMMTVAERAAIETSKGKKGRLIWEGGKEYAGDIKEKLGFHEHTRPAKNRVILHRDADVSSLKAARSVAR